MHATTQNTHSRQLPQAKFRRLFVLLALVQLFTTGYGLIAQSVVGWTDEVRTPYEIQRSVEVRGGDPSDHIYRVEPMGQLRRL